MRPLLNALIPYLSHREPVMNPVLSRLTRIIILTGLIVPLSAQEVEKPKAPVTVDPAPVSRQAGVITSFAPVVEKVAPSVVQISTTKNVKGGRSRNQLPFFNDPQFRRQFGIPDPDEDTKEDETPQPRSKRRNGVHKEALGLGSGVIVSKDGHVVTNNHVIEGADDIVITIDGDKKEYPAKKIGTDPGTDLAVLKVDLKGAPAITFADSDKLRVGDFAIAIGNPFGLTQSVTMGIVSSVGRTDMGIVAYENFIQTDASINPGNSGGALVDIEGRLIGVNTAIFSRTGTSAGIGFAVPANMVHSIMDSIIQNGRVVRGFLGVEMQKFDESLASKFKLANTSGVLVASVVKNSPAEKAGMKGGDVITGVNGKPVDGPKELQMTIGNLIPGTKLDLAYLRDGEKKTAQVTLVERETEDKLRPPTATPETVDPDVLDGVNVGDIDETARRKYGIAEDVKGVVVTEIQEDSPCATAGIRVGDVILSIEHKRVTSSDEAVTLSEKLKSEKEVLLQVSSKGATRYVVVKEE
jgi:serine protease Do